MKYRFLENINVAVLTLVLIATAPLTTAAGTPNTGMNGGQFTDLITLTWTANDGTDIVYGRGPRFCDVHPEITDPEYYLKEAVLYPGEAVGAVNSQGQPKAQFSPEAVEELKTWLHSFDWLHADELTRATMVHDRISNGYHGNVYEYPEPINGFPVLVKGKGMCGDFSGEFQRMANYVGLECETYTPFHLHQACLLKINGQWFATDPTSNLPFLSNAKTYPVDYQTEKERYGKEVDEKWDTYFEENPDSLAAIIDLANQKTAAGFITEADWARINPIETELNRKLSVKEISYEKYEKQMGWLLKSMWGK